MAQRYEGVMLSRKQIFFNNLIGGVAWGIGATIGLALLIGLLGLVGHYINFVPIIGNFVSQIIDFILQKNNHVLVPFIWNWYTFA